jgi:hypothetical protein
MRARALAVSLAVLLLAGTTAGTAAAAEGGRLADSPAARVASAPAGLGSLLPADQLAPTGPGQWYMPGLMGGAGSNYLGEGGWRSQTPFYGPYGPYPLPQTAAFYGATSSPLNPFTTGFGGGTNLGALTQTGLAPLASANINQLIGLGVGVGGLNALGQSTFTIGNGGSVFVVPTGQNFGNVTLGQITGQAPLVGFGGFGNLSNLGVFPGLGGLGGFGGGGFGGFGGFGTGVGGGTVSVNAVGQ